MTSDVEQQQRNAAALVELGVRVRLAKTETEDLIKDVRRIDRRVSKLARRLGVIEDLDAATSELRK